MKLVIAGGGTGGHVFPGIAVAQALKDLDLTHEVLFVGTAQGMERDAVPKAGFRLVQLYTSGLKGKSTWQKMVALVRLPVAIVTCLILFWREKPDAVLGVGGYASFPALFAALLMRIPTALCEQNSIPGFTNRMLAKVVRRVYTSFGRAKDYFPKNKVVLVGNPLRREFWPLASERPLSTGTDDHPLPRVLIMGGSQGARAINDIVPEALKLVAAAGQGFSVIHQTGRAHLDGVRVAYASVPFQVEVVPFIEHVADELLRTDLVICRSGATTCTELCAVGLASILIPYPFAIYDHQTFNAKELEEAGAALVMPQATLDAKNLSLAVGGLLKDQPKRKAMMSAAYGLGRRDAAHVIAKATVFGFRDVPQ